MMNSEMLYHSIKDCSVIFDKLWIFPVYQERKHGQVGRTQIFPGSAMLMAFKTLITAYHKEKNIYKSPKPQWCK